MPLRPFQWTPSPACPKTRRCVEAWNCCAQIPFARRASQEAGPAQVCRLGARRCPRTRQWFKSRQGLAADQTSRAISFCGHVVPDDAMFVVRDASQDPRFADNPLVIGDPSTRFYVGRPICSSNGGRIGRVCVIDSTPRDPAWEDLRALEDSGALVELEIRADALGETERELRARFSEAERRASIDALTSLWNRDTIIGLLRGAFAGLLGLQSLPDRAEYFSMSSSAISGQGSSVSRHMTALAKRRRAIQEHGPKGLHGQIFQGHFSAAAVACRLVRASLRPAVAPRWRSGRSLTRNCGGSPSSEPATPG